MAAMVARGSSPLASSISIQEKGSRNKRKFRADPPITDPNLISNPLQRNCPNYELFPIEKNPEKNILEHQQGTCDLCRNHCFNPPREELEHNQYQEADWIGKTEAELEETVLTNLDTIFKTAIRTVMSYGYTEEIATNAVLSAGLCYGRKDTVSNIVDNTISFLRNREAVDCSLRNNSQEELKKMEISSLNEMVNVLREFRPFFSRGDAMWRLLISDMNISLACAMDCNNMPSVETSASSIVPQVEDTSKLKVTPVYVQNPAEPDMPTVVGIPSLPCGRFSASINTQNSNLSFNSSKENAIPSLDCVIEGTSSLYISEAKPSGNSKKGHLGNSKRESILRQKTVHFEKSCRVLGSKAAIRNAKHNGLSSLLLDKKSKAISDSNAINMKNALMKLNKADPTHNISFKDVPMQKSNSNLTPTPTPSLTPTPIPVANTELSLSLPSTSNWAPQDEMDAMLQKLIPRVKELEAQMQEWSDWAQQKIMEAARRLSKDKPELQSLRQEREEVARLKKEKLSLEENTRKKLAEMEIALSKASTQVEKANADARERERENIELRKEMEGAKFRALESAESCEEVLKRETKMLKKFQSWEKQKALLHEELVAEKKKLVQLQQQVEQAREHRDQLVARWKQEERAKQEILIQHNAEKKGREQIDISGRSKENSMRLKAETDLQRYKDDIRKLEHEISLLRQNTKSLKWGTSPDGKKDIISKISKFQETGFQGMEEEIERERECVMCLSEEMSVVFLPCAHQVVCVSCNEIHEKQGMKDCPSCRAHIEKRILVRSAES